MFCNKSRAGFSSDVKTNRLDVSIYVYQMSVLHEHHYSAANISYVNSANT